MGRIWHIGCAASLPCRRLLLLLLLLPLLLLIATSTRLPAVAVRLECLGHLQEKLGHIVPSASTAALLLLLAALIALLLLTRSATASSRLTTARLGAALWRHDAGAGAVVGLKECHRLGKADGRPGLCATAPRVAVPRGLRRSAAVPQDRR